MLTSDAWKILVSTTSRQSVVACTQQNISFGLWLFGFYLVSLPMQWNYAEVKKELGRSPDNLYFLFSKYCKESLI